MERMEANYKRWRVTTLINGRRFWATVTCETGTEGEAKHIANKLFSFSAYSDRVKVSPVRSSIINPVPATTRGLHTEGNL